MEPGNYASVTISRSGTPGSPITFLGATDPISEARVNLTEPSGNGFLVSAAHDVVISGFDTFGALRSAPFEIDNSADITINGGSAHGTRALAAINVTGTSSNITISRVSAVNSSGPGVQIGAGVSGAVVTSNDIVADSPGPGVQVTSAPGTEVTGNTLLTFCSAGITVAGTSTGMSLQNNVIETSARAPSAPGACANPATATGVSVSSTSTVQTVTDYNPIDPASGGALYDWNGTNYLSLAAFTTATGQGAHDIAANPELGHEVGGDIFWYPITSASPAIDSANAIAPGELTSDLLGNPRADDPAVSNTGPGAGYYDRGAVELEGPISYGALTVQGDPAGGPLAVTAAAPVTTSWTTNGPIGTDAFSFSDGRPPIASSASSVEHTFATAGRKFVAVSQSTDDFLADATATTSTTIVVGADYTAVTPTRILDTRSGIGVGKAGAIPPGADLVLPIQSIGAVSASDISGIVANVTVTQPTAGGSLTVYSVPGTGTATSNINFSAHETVPNLVTVQPIGGVIRFHNGSAGTVQVVADLEGYDSNGGNGFTPLSPVRVLDTRNGTGAPAQPVAARGQVRLDLSGRLPAGAAAAVLNVTVTQPKAPGFLTAYPDGQPVPTASNLNFTSGETVPNLVIVPVTDGKADFYNGSGGTVQVVADLDGYFGSTGSDSFVPDGPTRIVDTRVALGAPKGPLRPGGTLVIAPSTETGCVPTCPSDTADVLNVTVTQAKASGFLTVYPAGQSRPGSSNLNFSAGETVPNLVTVRNVNGEISIYNGSGGSVQVVVDEDGYYIGAP